jgi:hypothetical protein
LKRIFASEVKVTEKTGKRITSVLTNHIKCAKEFNKNAPPQCLCHKLSFLANNSANLKSDKHGHLAIKATHLPPGDFGPIQSNNKEPIYVEQAPAILALQNSLDEFLPSIFVFKNISPEFPTSPFFKPDPSSDLIICCDFDGIVLGKIHRQAFTQLHNRFKYNRHIDPSLTDTFPHEVDGVLTRYNTDENIRTSWTTHLKLQAIICMPM